MRALYLFLLPFLAWSATPGRLPLIFEKNLGQAPKEVKYLARQGAAEVLLGRRILLKAGESGKQRMLFPGGRESEPVAERSLPGKAHYYAGRDRSRWIENAPTYGAVRYRGVYSGIDVVFHGNEGHLEYDFEIAPGADPRVISVRFPGAEGVEETSDGGVILRWAGGGSLLHNAPFAFQERGGRRVGVAVRYRRSGDSLAFELGEFDPGLKLTIDPVLVFSSRLATLNATLRDFAVDAEGNSYLGLSGATDYPFHPGLIFLKLNAAGTQVLDRTAVGGFSGETIAAVALDAQGNLVVAGDTTSSDYPVTSDACRGVRSDVFVTRLNTSGTLAASRCLGGDDIDRAVAVAVDPIGNMYVAGGTYSSNFPTTANAFRRARGTGRNLDAPFLAKLAAGGMGIVYSTYVSGTDEGAISSIAVDAAGALHFAGDIPGLPATAGAYLTTRTGTAARLVAKLAPDGGNLLYVTYLPHDFGAAQTLIGLDGQGRATVAFRELFHPFGVLRLLRLNPAGTEALLDRRVPSLIEPSSLVVGDDGRVLLSGFDVVLLDSNFEVQKTDSWITGSSRLARFGPGPDLIIAAHQTVIPLTEGAVNEEGTLSVVRTNAGATCNATLDPGFSTAIPVEGRSGVIGVLAPANCAWSASVSADGNWFFLTGAAIGVGNGILQYIAQSTVLSGGRRATLRLSDNSTYFLTQGTPPPCSPPQLPPVSPMLPGGGFGRLEIGLEEGCNWTAIAGAPWVRLPVASGMGRASQLFEVAPNVGPARTTTITVNGQNLIVSQNACSFSLYPDGPRAPLAGRFSLQLTTDPGCQWSISSNSPWLRLSPSGTQTGSRTVLAEIDENTSTAARQANISYNGITSSIVQAGVNSCLAEATMDTGIITAAGAELPIAISPSSCIPSVDRPSFATYNAANRTLAVPAYAGTIPRPFLVRVAHGNRTFMFRWMQDVAAPAAPFSDVPASHPFRTYISVLKERFVSQGCTVDGQKYCPEEVMTRAQMADYLARALGLQSGSLNQALAVTPFEDVPPSHPQFEVIQAIARAGITQGCSSSTGPLRFCPSEPVTRGQMAAFLMRALTYRQSLSSAPDEFTYSATPYFSDVPADHTFFRHVQALRAAGVTIGCGDGKFCVEQATSRAEMAAFVVRAFFAN